MEGKPGEWTVSASGHCSHEVMLPSLHIDSDSDQLGLGHPAASCFSNFIIKSHHLENLGLTFLFSHGDFVVDALGAAPFICPYV